MRIKVLFMLLVALVALGALGFALFTVLNKPDAQVGAVTPTPISSSALPQAPVESSAPSEEDTDPDRAPFDPSTLPDEDVPDPAVNQANAWVSAYVNAVSASTPSLELWTNGLESLSTPTLLATLAEEEPPFNSLMFDTAHEYGLSMKVDPYCFSDREVAGLANSMSVFCDYRATTVDASGNPIDINTLPIPWPYDGETTTALTLQMVNGGDGVGWRVDQILY